MCAPSTSTPSDRVDEIARPGAVAALDRALRVPLTYVSGPAGSAKTTTVAQWCRSLASAVVTWVDAAGSGPSSPPARAVETATATDDALPGDVEGGARRVVVVDRGGSSTPPELEHLLDVVGDRRGLHVVVIGRCPLPDGVAVHVAAGRVHHVPADQLAFGRDEALALAERIGADDLTDDEVDELVARTEGWPAGIAMSLRRAPVDGGRAGSRELVDRELIGAYLRSEALDGIDEDETAVLALAVVVGSVQPALVDHALGRPVGAASLDRLRSRGCFVRVAARGAPWVTFHPLLLAEVAGSVADDPEVIRRAAPWLSDRDLSLEAARCLVHLRDWDAAGALVQAHLPNLLAQDRFDELRTFLTELPGQVMRDNVPWAIGHAGLDIMAGRLAAAMETLAVIEPWLTPARRMMVQGMRASTVVFGVDPAPCIDQAIEALALCDELGEDFRFADMYTVSRTDHYRARTEACLVLAAAYDARWDLAERAFRPVRPATAAELPTLAWRAVLGRRASYLVLAGRLTEAEPALATVRRLDRDGHDFVVLEPGQAEVARAELLRARGNLLEAGELVTGALHDDGVRVRRNTWAWAVAVAANVHVDRREPDRALEELREFAAVPGDPPAPLLRGLLAAAEGRARSAVGDLVGARAALASAPVTDEVRAQQVATELAAGDGRAARQVLDGWTKGSTPGGRLRRRIAEVAVLEASGATRRAALELAGALDDATETGFVQPFLEQGLLLLRPLRRAASGDRPGGRLATEALSLLEPVASGVGAPLTPKEAVISSHLGRDVTIGVLAAELHLSANTVKSHLASIYRKLGVRSRAEAARALREQGSRPG